MECEGHKLPLIEEESETEEGGADPHTTSTPLKRQCPREQVGLRKKSKASKTSFDPTTLTEGNLHDIGETVQDVTMEALQQLAKENHMVMGVL